MGEERTHSITTPSAGLVLASAVLVAAKIWGGLPWPWWIVTLPLGIAVALAILVVLVVVLAAGFVLFALLVARR